MITISPKAFFFDFDGVICDTERAHMLSTMAVLKDHGITFTEEYYFEKLFGLDDRGLLHHLFDRAKKPLGDDLLKALMKKKNLLIMNIIDKEITHIAGVKDLINRLKEKSIPLCVVSGAIKKEVEACLNKTKLRSHFKFLISADMVRKSKPDPESYERAYVKMNKHVPDLKRNSCWVLEDSPAGVAAAKAAGLKVIGITNTTSAENLSKADAVVSDYGAIRLR